MSSQQTDAETLLKLGKIDAEVATFFRSTPLPPPDYSDISKLALAFKESSHDLRSLFKVPDSVTVTSTWYTATDGTKLRATVHNPVAPSANGSPLVVIFHGGGFCIGEPEDETQTCCNIVQEFSAICVSVQYRLAPDFPFPYAVTDAWDALKWAAESCEALGANPDAGFIVGGTSAGGNLTAVLTHLAKEQGLSPPLTGQYLAVPHVCPADRMPEKYQHRFLSYEQNKTAPLLPQAALDLFFGSYKADHDDSVNYSILLHPAGHAALPPAYFQVCGMDPLRDEALIYESVLREEHGIETRLDVYSGSPHCFWQILPMLKSSMKFREDQIRGFGWLLKREPQQSLN